MGYYTNYQLEIIEGNNPEIDYHTEISELADINNLFEDIHKWYDYHDDMIKYSKKHPNTLFKLIGEGEESGDLWHCYYKNGKKQFCKGEIVYPEYDESELI